LDQDLHEVEIQSKYSKEECLIQEKEIARLNNIQEEQGNRIKILQQDLLKLQDEVKYFNRSIEVHKKAVKKTNIFKIKPFKHSDSFNLFYLNLNNYKINIFNDSFLTHNRSSKLT